MRDKLHAEGGLCGQDCTCFLKALTPVDSRCVRVGSGSMGTWHPSTLPDLRDATFSRALSEKSNGVGRETERPLTRSLIEVHVGSHVRTASNICFTLLRHLAMD